MISIDGNAPSFSLPDQDGIARSLSDYRGSWIILYFYPKDDTPGCTKEACGFRDNYSAIQKTGAVILGVSKDSVLSHKKFSGKYSLPFPILSDETYEVIRAYGAWGKKKFMGREFEGILRTTVLIRPDQTIAKIYPSVNPSVHAEEILEDLRNRI